MVPENPENREKIYLNAIAEAAAGGGGGAPNTVTINYDVNN